jgi:hypothetical protein
MSKVKCDSCGQVIKIPVTDEIKGKTIQFRCKNEACGVIMKYKVPMITGRAEDVTIIQGSKTTKKVAKLQLKKNEFGESQLFALQKGKSIIGRKSSTKKVDIEINSSDAAMSRQHCSIEEYVDKVHRVFYIISDADSKAGTFLNGMKLHPIDEIYLEENDKIRLGRSTLIYKTT